MQILRLSNTLHYLLWLVGLASAETATTPTERDCLATHAKGRNLLVEIGVWHGVTTRRLRSVMEANGVLLAVDPFPAGNLGFCPAERIAHAEVRRSTNGSIQWLKMTGVSAAEWMRSNKPKQAIDFIFIVGDHSYEGLRSDWLAWSPLVQVGGIVALHDSRSSPGRVIDDAGSVKFTQEVILPNPSFRMIDSVESLTVIERIERL